MDIHTGMNLLWIYRHNVALKFNLKRGEVYHQLRTQQTECLAFEQVYDRWH